MKIKKGFMLRKTGGMNVVVAVGKASEEFNGMITLNETGAFLWEEISKGADNDTLLKRLLEEYDTDEAVARAGIDGFLKTAREAGLIDE